MRAAFHQCAFVGLAVVAALAASTSIARADRFTIFLRALNGDALNGAQLQAFKQEPGNNPAVQAGTITMMVNKQAAALVMGTSGPDGRIDVTITAANPEDRSIVFTANRAGQAVTAAVPFVLAGQNFDHTLHLVVPEALPQECACPIECCDVPRGRFLWRLRGRW